MSSASREQTPSESQCSELGEPDATLPRNLERGREASATTEVAPADCSDQGASLPISSICVILTHNYSLGQNMELQCIIP